MTQQQTNGKLQDQAIRRLRDSQSPPLLPPWLRRWGRAVAIVAGTLTLAATLTGAGWGASEFMGQKADETDLEELSGEVRELRGDVRAIMRHLDISR